MRQVSGVSPAFALRDSGVVSAALRVAGGRGQVFPSSVAVARRATERHRGGRVQEARTAILILASSWHADATERVPPGIGTIGCSADVEGVMKDDKEKVLRGDHFACFFCDVKAVMKECKEQEEKR